MLAKHLYNAQQFTTLERTRYSLRCIRLTAVGKGEGLLVEATTGAKAYRATLEDQGEWFNTVLNLFPGADTIFLQKVGNGKLRKPDPKESVVIRGEIFNCLGCDWKVTTVEGFPSIDRIWHDGPTGWYAVSPFAYDALLWSLKKTTALRRHVEGRFPHKVEIKHYQNSVFAKISFANTLCLTETCDTCGDLLHGVEMDGTLLPELLEAPDSMKFFKKAIFFRNLNSKEEYCVLPIVTV